jgi:polysaccharide biosynthesis/export protein
MGALSLRGQQAVGPANLGTAAPVTPNTEVQNHTNVVIDKSPTRVANYVLGPEDQIIIRAFHVEEVSDKTIQVGGDGYINLPMVGRIKVAGLTVSGLEQGLTERLQGFVRDPQVSVFIAEFRSQPVSVVGAVNSPGVVQLRGRKDLVEVIALAGGLKAEAGNTITITRELSRGQIPLASSTVDSSGKFSVAHVNLHDVMTARNPQDNITIETNDVIMIPKAQMLYVVGEVQKPGAYVLNERDSVSVLQAVSLAGGLTQMASAKRAKILHQDTNQSTRTELQANVSKILSGQSPDIDMHADDILFVPSSLSKSAGSKALQTALNMAGVAVWRF